MVRETREQRKMRMKHNLNLLRKYKLIKPAPIPLKPPKLGKILHFPTGRRLDT